MSIEENKQIVHRLVQELWNAHNVAAADELISADLAYHDLAVPSLTGLEGFKAYTAAMFVAYPDYHSEIDDEIGEGDKVAVIWTFRGTHLGPLPFIGTPATGKHLETKGITIYRIADGKVVELSVSYDLLAGLQQVGAIPVPA